MKPTIVYQLVDCSTGTPFYVGITIQMPSQRLYGHRNEKQGAAYARISDLAAKGIDTRLETLEICQSGRRARDIEADLIAAMPNLLNRAKPSPSPTRGIPLRKGKPIPNMFWL